MALLPCAAEAVAERYSKEPFQLQPSLGRSIDNSRRRWSSALRPGLPVTITWSPMRSVSREIPFPFKAATPAHSIVHR